MNLTNILPLDLCGGCHNKLFVVKAMLYLTLNITKDRRGFLPQKYSWLKLCLVQERVEAEEKK